MNIENNATKLSRNPLGIIALFILLIYGFASLLFGLVGNIFSENQKWCFVIFLVSFPCLVLGVFTYLVSRHHQKLYAPSEFKYEEHFFGHGKPSQNQYDEEIDEISRKKALNDEEKRHRDKIVKQRQEEREKSQKIENLVFEYYEKNFNYSIDRNIYYKINDTKIFFDGIVKKEDCLTFMKIKYLSTDFLPSFLLNMTVMNALKVQNFLMNTGKYPDYTFRLLLTFVIDSDDLKDKEEMNKKIRDIVDIDTISIGIRVLSVKDLERS